MVYNIISHHIQLRNFVTLNITLLQFYLMLAEMLRRIGSQKPKIFGIMDLTQGYHQAPLTFATRAYSAIINIHFTNHINKACKYYRGHDFLEIRWSSLWSKGQSCELIYPRKGNECRVCSCCES